MILARVMLSVVYAGVDKSCKLYSKLYFSKRWDQLLIKTSTQLNV